MSTITQIPAATAAQRWLDGFLKLDIDPREIYRTQECLDLLTGDAIDTAPCGFDGLIWTFKDGSLLVANSFSVAAVAGTVTT
jgi:hypothetical protein